MEKMNVETDFLLDVAELYNELCEIHPGLKAEPAPMRLVYEEGDFTGFVNTGLWNLAVATVCMIWLNKPAMVELLKTYKTRLRVINAFSKLVEQVYKPGLLFTPACVAQV